ncbi:TraB/GumN family protein [uncultured Pedobacter sp.]|uniref:TraB/GumN family protein n=1 Tax=uncultured Pedobacter sp. TaxID=246139 RepID=UPI0025FDB92B|nr:TraB/GumN family protein [uncultured Pedobacter sp.]
MKNIKLLLVALLCFVLNLNAQPKKATNTLLWEVSGNGLKKPSYLFGTHHFTNKEFADTMQVLQEKLKSVNGVVGEIVMDGTLQGRMAPFLVMKNNTLDSVFTPAEYKEVDDYIKARNPAVNLKQLNRFKPAMVGVLIMLLDNPEMRSLTNGIDESFQKYAKDNAKSIHGLETAEYQGALLFDDDLQKQKKALLKSVRESDKNKIKLQELTGYYLAQDIDKLTQFFKAQDEETKEFMTEMLKNRNQRWLDQLPALMEKESLFIAVGAGHLVGNDGLIKGLQAKGYTLKPIATNKSKW